MKKPPMIAVVSFAVAASLATFVFIKSTTSPSVASVYNDTAENVTAYLSFGSDSVVLPTGTAWAFCTNTSNLNCSFPLAPHASQELPLAGKYLNVTISFGGQGCGATKAELNVNNPKWYDITDVSLVDGYSNKIAIDIEDATGRKELGPPKGPSDNEKVYGLFPLGCDICVARQSPPCGMKPGTDGCKTGGQYDPSVPCQYRGPTKSGGSRIRVDYLGN
jgi:hypothetical protein